MQPCLHLDKPLQTIKSLAKWVTLDPPPSQKTNNNQFLEPIKTGMNV